MKNFTSKTKAVKLLKEKDNIKDVRIFSEIVNTHITILKSEAIRIIEFTKNSLYFDHDIQFNTLYIEEDV